MKETQHSAQQHVPSEIVLITMMLSASLSYCYAECFCAELLTLSAIMASVVAPFVGHSILKLACDFYTQARHITAEVSSNQFCEHRSMVCLYEQVGSYVGCALVPQGRTL
jgi:hypothetical protein